MKNLDNLACWGIGIISGLATGFLTKSPLAGIAATGIIIPAGYYIRDSIFYEEVEGETRFSGRSEETDYEIIDKRTGERVSRYTLLNPCDNR